MAEANAKKQIVGTWGFHSHKDFSKSKPEECNVWFFEQVFNFLRSFYGLVMPDNMEIITYNATQHIKKDKLTQQTFLDEFMLILKGLKEPIWTFRLNLGLVGFIRTHHDPDKTVRVQIQEPSSFIVWGGPDETGFQTFSISYHLFNAGSLQGSDEMLWSVNQPFLEKSLKKWEKQTGKALEVVKGNAPNAAGQPTRHGFKRPTGPERPRAPMPSGAPAVKTGAPVVQTTTPVNPATPAAKPAPARPSTRPAGAKPIQRS